MSRFIETLRAGELPVIVSLPENDPVLARAARRGGAAGLKVHLNVHHHASGTRFGSFDEERERIESVLDAAGDLVVGIMPGTDDGAATPAELHALAELGIDFLDMYAPHVPAAYSEVALAKVLALGGASLPGDAASIRALGGDAIEASVVAQAHYGRPLEDADVALYAAIVREARGLPVIVPSQKALTPDDLGPLIRIGVSGFFLGAVVTGKTAASIQQATASFRKTIDQVFVP